MSENLNSSLTDSPQPFTDHLEDLRWCLIKCLLCLVITMAASFFYVDRILEWLARPMGEFIFTSPTEAFFVRFKIALFSGILLSFPYFLFQIWRFVEIALNLKERSIVKGAVPFSCLFFYLGVGIALFVVVPSAMKFLMGFSSPYLKPMISFSAYLSFLLWMMIGFGLFFQLPLIIVFLTSGGVVSHKTWGNYRKHIFIGILVIAAFLTPGPDIFSQLAMALPAYILFELSLLFSKYLLKTKNNEI